MYGENGQDGVAYYRDDLGGQIRESSSLMTVLFSPVERLEMLVRFGVSKHRLTRVPDACLLVEEGFELGELPFDCSGNGPIVVRSSDARSGNYMMQSTLSVGSKVPNRTEVYFPGDTCHLLREPVYFDLGTEYWIGISIKLGKDFADNSSFLDQGMLMQWQFRDHPNPSVPIVEPLLLRYSNGQVHVHNEVLQEYMASVAPAYGEWVDWVFHVKFSDQDGIIRVWRDKTLIVDWRGNNQRSERHKGLLLKLGLYSNQYRSGRIPNGSTRTVYHDELRVAGADGDYGMVAPR